MKRGKHAGDVTVDFFELRGIFVVHPQTDLDAPYRYAFVKRSKAGGKGRGGVAVHQWVFWAPCGIHVPYADRDAACNIGEILPMCHYAQVEIGDNAENGDQLIQHARC